MSASLLSNPDGSGPLTIEVRNNLGDLIRRTHLQNADRLVRCGLGEWIGRANKRYVRLTDSAPAVPSRSDWRGGSRTTQRIRNADGIMIAPDFSLEHKALP